LTFEPGDGVVCFVNSTELLRIVVGSGVTVLGGEEVRLSRKEEFSLGMVPVNTPSRMAQTKN